MAKHWNKYLQLLLLTLLASQLIGCASSPDAGEIPDIPFPAPPNDPRLYYDMTLFTSADVEEEASDLVFRRMITGEQRVGTGLAKPFEVAVHQGRVFVSDTVKRLVSVFDMPQRKYFEIGSKSPGELFKPMGLDVDDAGRLYVLDARKKSVNVYDRDGKFIKDFGRPEEFSRPSGLTVDPQGKQVFVVDTGGVQSNWHRIVVFDVETGEFVRHISTRGAEDGELNLPREAVLAPNGNLYVVDGGNFRVQAFSPEGEYLYSFGSIGLRSGQFSRPKGIAADKDSNLYVVDTAFGNFQIFNPKGQLLMHVGSRNAAHGPAHFMLPSGIDVDEDGRVYMVDQYFRKIEVFRPVSVAKGTGYFSKQSAVPKE
jgi:DNA-binding beta-propeller fold protein YncE